MIYEEFNKKKRDIMGLAVIACFTCTSAARLTQ